MDLRAKCPVGAAWSPASFDLRVTGSETIVLPPPMPTTMPVDLHVNMSGLSRRSWRPEASIETRCARQECED